MFDNLTPQQLKGLAMLGDAIASLTASNDSIFVTKKTTVLYSNPQKAEGFTVMEGKHYVAAPSDTVQGRISELRYHDYGTPDKRDIRWILTLNHGNENVIILCHHDRIFSNSMLAAIAQMSPEQLKEPVQITCKKWTAELGNAHFCNVVSKGERIDAPRIEGGAVNAIAAIAQELVADANGYEYRPNGKN